ncbi:MAG: thioredoxin domain-containing protein, partial [Candidatus Sulfotelmatobacter sp.]
MKTLSSYLRTFYPRTLFLLFLTALLLANSLCAAADEAVNPVLRPPKGAPVAIIVFEDLQCPQCRRVSPILEQASKTYKIPLVRHDFPLPMHN